MAFQICIERRPEWPEACLNAGMDDYLCKPFTFDEFSRLLNKWMQVEQFPVIPPDCSANREMPPGA